MVFVCLPVSAGAEQTDEPEYVEGEILITSKKEVEDSEGKLFTASANDDMVMLDFEETGIEHIEEVENYTDEENLYIAEVDGNVEKICEELSENEDIVAEPNYILHTCEFNMPSEVKYSTSLYASYEKNYFENILHIPEAWQAHEVTGNGVTIAIIDDGFNTSHPDIDKTKLWKNSKGTYGWNTYNNSDNISPIFKSDGSAFDNTSHGSNVAGIIGMKPNGSGGIGGAYNATLMLLQGAYYQSDDSNPGFTANSVSSAIDFARENGADIITMSLSTTSDSSTIGNAVQRAYNAGILLVAAAGNSGNSTGSVRNYPAAYSQVIGVMALDNSLANHNKLTDFSNYDTGNGLYYNIAAPGVSVLGCNYDKNYSLNSGTSQATPLVAAVAALYMEKHPDATIQELTDDMLISATDTVTAYNSTRYTYKSLNALKFLNYVNPPVININLYTDAVLSGDYLYGLNEGFTAISNYISVEEGTGTMEFTPAPNGCGTGSRIDVYDIHNNLFKTIYVVIFGDLNGDTIADGQDAVLTKCLVSGFGTFSNAQTFAADVDNDTVASVNDVDVIMNYAVFNDFISQTR